MSDSSHSSRYHHNQDYRSRYHDYYNRYSPTPDCSNNRRVPGLVSDPDAQLGDANQAIQRGQRETVARYQSGRYSPRKSSKPTQDTMSSPTRFNSSITTVSQLYNPTSLQNAYYRKSRRRLPINPGFLAFLPGLTGCGLLIAAIVIVSWQVETIICNFTLRIVNKGLFQVCTTDIPATNSSSCQTSEEFANAGSVLSDLEEATQILVIIAAVLAFVSVVVSFILGCNKWRKKWGMLVIGGLYAFSGACGVAAMGCYSAVLVDNTASSTGVSTVTAGISFYLGWMGASSLIIASITAFLGFSAHHK